MPGSLVAGWEKAAVAHASCRRALPQRRVVPTRARRATQSNVTLGVRLSTSTYRRHAWRTFAAEEVAEEAVPPKTEDGSQGEASDALEEQPLEQAEPEESEEDRVQRIVDEMLRVHESDLEHLEIDTMRSYLMEIQDIVGALSRALEDAEAVGSQTAEEESEQQNKYLRLSADFENFRKRSATEKAQLKESVTSDVVLQLLPIIDNFELARGQVNPANEGEEKINNSYQGLYKQMVDTFKSLGVEPINAKGQPFDPEVHEAIMREPNDDVPDGTVLDEFRRGFTLKGKLMRAAMVKVSHSEESAAPPTEGGSVPEPTGEAPDGVEGLSDSALEEEAAVKQKWKEVSPE